MQIGAPGGAKGDKAIAMITAQQDEAGEGTAPWMVGEQLKDICRREPHSAELIAADLENPKMGIAEAEKKIKAWADGHRKGNFACVTPDVAERILREFYGLPAHTEKPAGATRSKIIDLEDYL